MIKGIDVYHEDTLTPAGLPPMIKANGLCFAFIKSSTGINGKDDMFGSYWSLCQNAGLLCGAYHWLWPASDAVLQAENYINQIKTVNTTGALAPAVDIEWTWNDGDAQTTANELWGQMPGANRAAFIKQFLNTIETGLNMKPIIYTSAAFWVEFLDDYASDDDNQFFANYPLWIADPSGNGNIPKPWAGKTADYTQTHDGENSTSTDPFDNLDQDVYNGTILQFLNSALPGLVFANGYPYSPIVEGLQAALQNNGALTDAPDGYFGPDTQNAVTTFQNNNGLTANGIIDSGTWNALLR